MAGGVRSRHRVKNGMKPLVRTKLSQLVNLVSDISQDMRCVRVCVCVGGGGECGRVRLQ